MNPTLTQWLDNYNAARAQYRDETRLLPVDALLPERPREMQFTLTSTGLLRDVDGRRICHVTDLSPLDLRQLGVDPERLTARQRRRTVRGASPTAVIMDEAAALHSWEEAPIRHDEDHIPDDAAPGDIVTRRGERVGIVGRNGRNEVVVVRDPNPMHDRLRRPPVTLNMDENGDVTALGNDTSVSWEASPEESASTTGTPEQLAAMAATDPILANLRTAYAGATTLPNPTAEDLQAAMGTPMVTGLDVEQERTIMESLNAAMNAQPNPFVTGPIRLDQIHTPNLSASAVSYDRISNALSSVSDTMAAATRANLAPNPEPEVYVGPRMVATIAQPPASAERYAQHTAGREQAHLRAGQIYHQRPSLYGSAVRRASTEAPNGAMVDRNAGAVTTFLSEGYGIELNEEALNATSAMVNTFCRMAALPHITRADGLQANVESLDREVITLQNRVRELEADAQHRGEVVGGVLTAPAPGTVEAAFLAAKAWKETGHEDSVAKLASFKHLLDTLENLAR